MPLPSTGLVCILMASLMSSEVPQAHFKTLIHCKQPESVILQKPRDITIDDKGNIFILDQDEKKIHAWDKQGQYLATIGREGQGPGEIALLDGVGCLAVTREHLIVSDDRIRKIHFWDREFQYKTSISRPVGIERISAIEAYGDKLVIGEISTSRGDQRLLLLNEEFDILEVLAVVDDNVYQRNEYDRYDYRPFADLLIVGFDKESVWYANANHNWIRNIRNLDMKGKVGFELRVPLVANDLNQAEKDQYITGFKRWRTDKDTITFPEKGRVLSMIIPLENNLVAVSQFEGSNGGKCKGFVFKKDTGKIVGKFTQFLGDEVGVFAALRGKLVIVSADENDDYRVSIQKIVLEERNEPENKD